MRASSGTGWIVERFGPHPARALGLDLDTPPGREAWLVAAVLLGDRATQEAAASGFRALATEKLVRTRTLAGCAPERLAALLRAAGRSRPERAAALLVRLARAVEERHGSLERLCGGADDLLQLGEALVGLAPGFGPGAALRFLRPLRDVWPAAREVPLEPAARAAAVHLGWIAEDADLEGEPGALRAALAESVDAPALADVEAALARLGRAACERGRPARCPLGERCPRREADPL